MTQITNFLPLFDETKIPQKTGSQTNEQFMANADYCTAFIPNLITTANSAIAEANILSGECNSAAVTCLAGQRFRGLWEELTGSVEIGDSVWHLSKFWICVTANSNITTQIPGTSAIWKEWSLPLDSVNVLATLTPAAAATVNITDVITSVYSKYEIQLQNVIPATDNVSFLIRTSDNNGSTWSSGATDYDWDVRGTVDAVSSGETSITPFYTTKIGNDINEYGVTGSIFLYNPSNTSAYKEIKSILSMVSAPGALTGTVCHARRRSTSVVNGLQLSFSSGNIESGTIIVRGYK